MQDRRLTEVLYAIKEPIRSYSKDEKVISLSSPFETDIHTLWVVEVIHARNQKGCPLAHWIIGKLYAKN